MAGDDLKAAWVLRVLGVQTQAPTGPGSESDLMGLWQDAKEEVDARMQSLAQVLRGTDDPDLHRLADKGLFGIGAGETVKLTAALLDYQRAPSAEKPRWAKAVSASVQQYRALLASGLVAAIDANPFGQEVGLRSTIAPALDRIQQSVALA